MTEALDTETVTGRLVPHMLAALSAFERNLIRERTLAAADEVAPAFGGEDEQPRAA